MTQKTAAQIQAEAAEKEKQLAETSAQATEQATKYGMSEAMRRHYSSDEAKQKNGW